MNEQERAAMQQALEALELMVVDVKTTPTAYEAQRQAITALRAALAQKQADGRVVIEQRGGRLYMNNAEIDPGTLEIRRDGVTYRAAERVAVQPEPAQEPVAWECKAGGLKALTQRQYDAQTAAIKRHYTRIAPPQRPRLTDEEIDSIHIHLSNTVGSSYKTLARAIERKVRGEE